MANARVMRAMVLSELDRHYSFTGNEMVIDEMLLTDWMAVSNGVRADVAILSPTLAIGVEIKAKTDNLNRLRNQAVGYDLIFDENWVAVDSKHLSGALEIIPKYWGVLVLGDGGMNVWRTPEINPARSLRAMLERVWVQDVRWLIKNNPELDMGPGLASRGKATLIKHVLLHTGNKGMEYRRQLLCRYQDRRSGALPMTRRGNTFGPTSTIAIELGRVS